MRKLFKLVEDYDKFSRDGWPEDLIYTADLDGILDATYDVRYELKNSVRGSFTRCTTIRDLGYYIEELGQALADAGTYIKDHGEELEDELE